MSGWNIFYYRPKTKNFEVKIILLFTVWSVFLVREITWYIKIFEAANDHFSFQRNDGIALNKDVCGQNQSFSMSGTHFFYNVRCKYSMEQEVEVAKDLELNFVYMKEFGVMKFFFFRECSEGFFVQEMLCCGEKNTEYLDQWIWCLISFHPKITWPCATVLSKIYFNKTIKIRYQFEDPRRLTDHRQLYDSVNHNWNLHPSFRLSHVLGIPNVKRSLKIRFCRRNKMEVSTCAFVFTFWSVWTVSTSWGPVEMHFTKHLHN